MLLCCEKNRAWKSASPCFSENIRRMVFSEKQKEQAKKKKSGREKKSDERNKKTISGSTK